MQVFKTVHSALGQVSSWVGAHHQRRARPLGKSTVGVAQAGIKIDGIARPQNVFFGSNQQSKRPAQNVYEFDTLVGMRPGALARCREFRQVGMELAIARPQVEFVQEATIVAGRIAGSSLLPFFPSRDSNYTLPFLTSKKVVESHIEHESDAKQGGNSRKMLAVLNSREQRRRETGAFTELQEPHAAAQAKDPQFWPDEIACKLKSQPIRKLHLAFPFRKNQGSRIVDFQTFQAGQPDTWKPSLAPARVFSNSPLFAGAPLKR